MASPNSEYPSGKDLLPLEYEAIKERVHKGAKILAGHWDDPDYADKIYKYNQLCRQMLDYEIENDLLPI
jgi:L-arabinose isomerase